MSEIFPKKTVISLLVLIVIALVVSNVASVGRKEREEKESKDIQEKKLQMVNQDTDADGLKDWQELLYGTEINNPDSDGDGTFDGEEVALNRDPLVPGPDDEKRNILLVDVQPEDEIDEALTETDKFSRDIFKKYIQTKNQLDSEWDSSDVENIANDLIDESVFADDTYLKKYSASDLRIVYKNDKKTLQAYLDQMYKILVTDIDRSVENDIQIAMGALENNNKEELKKLEPLQSYYESILTKMLSVVVPDPAIQKHLALVNDYSNLITANEYMQSFIADPITGLKGAQLYFKTEEFLLKDSADLGRFFFENNIQFSQ